LGKIESSLKAQKQKSLPERLKAYEQLDKDIKESENQAHLSSLKQESDDIIATVKADPASLATKEKWLEDVNSEHFAGLKEEIAVLTKRLNSFMDGFSKTETVSISKEEYEKLLSEVQAYSSSDANRLKAGYESAQKAAQNWIADKIAEFEQISEDKVLRSAFVKFRTAFKSIDSHPAGKAVEIQSAWMKASQKLFKRLSEDTVLSLEKKQNMIDNEKPFEKAYKEIGDAKKYIEESDLNEFKNKFSDAFRDSSELPWPPATIIPQETIENWAKVPLEEIKREIQKYLASEIEKDFETTDLERWKEWAKFLTENKKQVYLTNFPNEGVAKYLQLSLKQPLALLDAHSFSEITQKLIFVTGNIYNDMRSKAAHELEPPTRLLLVQTLASIFSKIYEQDQRILKDSQDNLNKTLILKDLEGLCNGKIYGEILISASRKDGSKIITPGKVYDSYVYENLALRLGKEEPRIITLSNLNFPLIGSNYVYKSPFERELTLHEGKFLFDYAICFITEDGRVFNGKRTDVHNGNIELTKSKGSHSEYAFGRDVEIKIDYKVKFD